MRQIVIFIMLILGINIFSAENKNTNIEEKVQIKTFLTLKEAAENYGKVMEMATNYEINGETISVNPLVDSYVLKKNDPELLKKWGEINFKLYNNYEYVIHKINGLKSFGEVVYIIKAYDQEQLAKYISENSDKYNLLNEESGEKEVSVEDYIDLIYNYLNETPKKEYGEAKIDFIKVKSGWRIVEKK